MKEMKFIVSSEEADRAHKFVESHKCELRGEDGEIYVGAIGGAFAWCFTNTGLGQIVEVRCACGAAEVITDFSEW